METERFPRAPAREAGRRKKSETAAARLAGLVVCLIVAIVVTAFPSAAQRFDGEIAIYADGLRLERPASVAISPSGEQMAVSDPQVNRIAVIDYLGRPLWAAGGQVDLGRPLAVALVNENEVIFTRTGDLLVVRVTRDNPTEFDTVADLAVAMDPERRFSQLVRMPDAGWLALDEKAGEILRFDEAWQFKGTAVAHGSGKGKVLAPTSITPLDGGRFIVTDERNYPAQMFSADGEFLLYFGWSSPGEQRGWEAVAAAVDNRNVIWVADRTKAVFRLFDSSGGEVGGVPFPNPLFRPAAMAATIDNRVFILEETGRALFYRLE